MNPFSLRSPCCKDHYVRLGTCDAEQTLVFNLLCDKQTAILQVTVRLFIIQSEAPFKVHVYFHM